MNLAFKQVENIVHMRHYTFALDEFHQRHSQYPKRLEEAVIEADLAPETKNSLLPLRDSWGHGVRYESDESSYLLVSFGRDGRPDGSDYSAMRAVGRLDNAPCRSFDADIVLTDQGELRNCGK
jgi:hypothetical protein